MNRPYALVTGSSDRVGKAISLKLAQMGYNLILHYNNSQLKAEKLKKEIINLGVKVEVLKINFSNNNDFEAIFKELSGRLDIDLLVNCASDFYKSNFSDAGIDHLHHMLKVNFESAYLLTKAFVSCCKKGSIINIIDTKADKNQTVHLDYLLSKKLLKEFTTISAFNLGPNFRVNGISPGLILPPKGKDQGYLLEMAQSIPLKTYGNLALIQQTVEFLITNEFITGQIIYVDGGEHL